MMTNSSSFDVNSIFDVLYPTASLILIINALMSSMTLGSNVFLALLLVMSPIVFATSGQMFEVCAKRMKYPRLMAAGACMLRVVAVVMALVYGPSICFENMLVSSGIEKVAYSASFLALVVFGLVELKALILKVKVKIGL